MPENKDQKTSNTETFQAVHGIISEVKDSSIPDSFTFPNNNNK